MILTGFLALAGLEESSFSIPFVIMCAMGFLGPFAYFKAQERAYRKAYSEEYDALERRDNA